MDFWRHSQGFKQMFCCEQFSEITKFAMLKIIAQYSHVQKVTVSGVKVAVQLTKLLQDSIFKDTVVFYSGGTMHSLFGQDGPVYFE